MAFSELTPTKEEIKIILLAFLESDEGKKYLRELLDEVMEA